MLLERSVEVCPNSSVQDFRLEYEMESKHTKVKFVRLLLRVTGKFLFKLSDFTLQANSSI